MTSVLKDIKLWRGSADLSGKSNFCALAFTTDALKDTGFGVDSHTYEPGLNGARLQHRGFLDLGSGSQEEKLWDEHGTADLPLAVAIDSNIGSRAYLLRGIPSELSPGGAVGELYGFSVSAQGSGSIARGITLEVGATARESTFNGAAQQAPAAIASGETLFGALMVLSASGSSPTLDVVVESDSAQGMSSPTTQLTFAQQTAAGHDWQTAAGPITDTWYRIVATIGGGSPSFTFVVAIGAGT